MKKEVVGGRGRVEEKEEMRNWRRMRRWTMTEMKKEREIRKRKRYNEDRNNEEMKDR